MYTKFTLFIILISISSKINCSDKQPSSVVKQRHNTENAYDMGFLVGTAQAAALALAPILYREGYTTTAATHCCCWVACFAAGAKIRKHFKPHND